MPGQGENAAAFHGRCFDKEDVTADGRPCQTCRDSDLVAFEKLFLVHLRPSEELIQVIDVDFPCFLFTDGHLLRDLAAHRCDFAFEVSKPGFLRVLIDNGANAFIGELDLALFQAVLRNLFREEMTLRDFEFLFFGIAAELDDLHTIAECGLDRVQHVRGRDEHDVRKIERNAEIVIPERMVLLRIQNFEKCR